MLAIYRLIATGNTQFMRFQHHFGVAGTARRDEGIASQFNQQTKRIFEVDRMHKSAVFDTRIADAAGFNDARRLQYNMQRVMRRTPKELRIKPSNDMQPIVIPLAYRPPYNWLHLRDFLARRAILGTESIEQNSYARNFTLGGSKGHFHALHQPDKNRFQVTLTLDDLTQLKPALNNIRRILDVDADSTTIDNQIQQSGLDPKLITPGIRIPGIWDTFEAGCRAILGQQISVTCLLYTSPSPRD